MQLVHQLLLILSILTVIDWYRFLLIVIDFINLIGRLKRKKMKNFGKHTALHDFNMATIFNTKYSIQYTCIHVVSDVGSIAQL